MEVLSQRSKYGPTSSIMRHFRVSPGMPPRGHRWVAALLTLALSAVLAACNSGGGPATAAPTLSRTSSATGLSNPIDQDALKKAEACGLSVGLDKLKALGPDGNNLLDAINATLAGRDLAANRADLLKASVQFGIDIGPPWLQCFEPFFFPDHAGSGTAPAAPTDLTVKPDPNNGTVMLLTWADSSDNVLYSVVSNGVEERNVPMQSSGGTATYTWTGLQPGSWSCFRVRATNGDTSSDWDPNAAPGYECAYTSSPQPSTAAPIPTPTPAASASLSSSAFIGTWIGSYVCSQGQTGLKLVIQAAPHGILTATFNFFALSSNPGVPSGSYTMAGTLSSTGADFTQDQWINQPPGYEMVDLSINPPSDGGTHLNGTITTCGTIFILTRASSG